MSDVQAARRKLEARLSVLDRRSQRIEGDLRRRADSDSQERATERENDEVLQHLGDAERIEIDQVRRALARIERGEYGNCDDCGDPIADDRLRVAPETTLCISCA
jgi:RNA polymerase-binding transcription factor DksA